MAADLEQMTRMWAVENYIGHWDGYIGRSDPTQPNNYFLHSDPDGRFRMLPWGTDQAWVTRESFETHGGVLFRRCLDDVSCSRMYRAAVRRVADTLDDAGLGAQLEEMAAMVAPWKQRDPRRETSMQLSDLWLEIMRRFIAERPADAARWLNPPPPTGRTYVPPKRPSKAPAGPTGPLTLNASLRSRNSLSRVRRHGLRVRPRCSGGCHVLARARLPRKLARRVGLGSRPVVLGEKLGRGGTVLTVRFGPRSRRGLRRLRSAGIVVELAATDGHGRVANLRRRVVLRG